MKLEKSNWALACVRLLLSWHLASSLVSVILLHIPHSYSIQYSIFPIRFNESINQHPSIVVDWAAHLGGLIAGFTSAFLCFAPTIKTKFWAVFWFIIGVAMNVGMYTGLLIYMYTKVDPMDDLDDICGYYQQFFEGYECVCQKD